MNWRVGLLALCLAGCVSTPRPQPTDGVAVTQDPTALQGWRDWHAVGRLAVKTASGGFNAHFDWHQAGPVTELVVEGPFGAGHSRIRATPERILVESGSAGAVGLTPPFDGLDAVLVERIGFPVPVLSVGFWLRGVPDPSDTVEWRADGFVQSGWSVQPEGQWVVDQAPGMLPRRVTFTQSATRIRVAVDQWVSGAL